MSAAAAAKASAAPPLMGSMTLEEKTAAAMAARDRLMKEVGYNPNLMKTTEVLVCHYLHLFMVGRYEILYQFLSM